MKAYEIAAGVKPTDRQYSWQETEFYGIVYYGMNTFTGKEIGDGFAVPETFCPENIDTDQWAESIKLGGMKGVIITAKHYDGFCCWQTETTDYGVKNSNWLEGKGDIVKMVQESAEKFSLKFGIYMPVWDKHEKYFKDPSGKYNIFFQKQLEELLTNYGDIFALWLDDRCDDEMVFDFDYKGVYSLVRRLQPDCAIVFRGPDGRWVGNGKGVTRQEEWSSVPASYSFAEDGSVPFSVKKKKYGQMETDIGSRKAIRGETNFLWAPCEVNYPMRTHWFYRKDDDYLAKTKDKILDMYYRTVGNNSNLMLGLAPDKKGRLHDTDVQILKALGHDLKIIFGYNLLKDGKVAATSTLDAFSKIENVITQDGGSFWSPLPSDKKPEITINFNKTEMFDKVILKENIRNGQHIEDFTVFIKVKNRWKKFYRGSAVGHKKICTGKPVETDAVKIVFTKYRKLIEISLIQIN